MNEVEYLADFAEITIQTDSDRMSDYRAEATELYDFGRDVSPVDSGYTAGLGNGQVILDEGAAIPPAGRVAAPRRSQAYMDTLRDMRSSRGRASLDRRKRNMVERSLSNAATLYGGMDDFGEQATVDAGIQSSVGWAKMHGAAAHTVGGSGKNLIIGGKKAVSDVMDGTMTAKEAAVYGGKLFGMEGKRAAKNIGTAGVRNMTQYALSFQASASDFAGSAPATIKNAVVTTVQTALGIKGFLLHPIKAILAAGKVLLALALVLLVMVIVTAVSNMLSTTVTTTLCARTVGDVQTLVERINSYRNETLTTEIYNAFRNDRDPNGNPYGYTTLGGGQSNGLQHGVTWDYANGICNNTAEIISLAAVYYQQIWPVSSVISDFGNDEPFTKFCRDISAYGLDVVARESSPYSCIVYGGCVYGYRSEGETVTIQDYRQSTHYCSEGNSDCGEYNSDIWVWDDGHSSGGSYTEWIEDGTHEVTVYFPLVFPDGAANSGLCVLPEGATRMESGTIGAGSCTGSIVLPTTANLYTGTLNDWFHQPGAYSATFGVVIGSDDDAFTDTYTVSFTNATAIPWCPGELHDGQFGHYDLNCTIYLIGYDEYEAPELSEPDGSRGGTGTMHALVREINDGRLTRTVIKQNQYGQEYAGNALSARFTGNAILPAGGDGFTSWLVDGEDAAGNVEWASILYKMDWDELYGISDGIKCQTVGSMLTAAELAELLDALGLDPDSARGQVVAYALGCQGRFIYGQPTSLSGGPGAPVVGINLDCSSFIRYCYWAVGLPFSAGQTRAYATATDLTPVSSANVQPGDLRVVYAAGGEQGHVQMYIGGGSWVECCYGYGVSINMSNNWMTSRPCHYFSYVGFN